MGVDPICVNEMRRSDVGRVTESLGEGVVGGKYWICWLGEIGLLVHLQKGVSE